MSKELILSLDQGTSSSRAIVFAPGGRILGQGQVPLPISTPQPGWVECEPEMVWASQLDAARRALAAADVSAKDIAAIGITNQRETTLAWDKTSGAPLGPGIVWQDRRTSERCQQIRSLGAEAWLTEKTGLRADPYFSATKMEWILGQLPSRAADVRLGTVDTWLLHRLTGGASFFTDRTNASRTMLMDLESGQWDRELLRYFGVRSESLPEIRPSAGFFGETDPSILGAPIPILGVAGDQQAALLGQGCTQAGEAKNTYGTGCFLLMSTGEARPRSQFGLLGTTACEGFALEGAVFVAGAAVQWLRDGLGIISSSDEMESLASLVPDSGDVWFVPAFTGLGTPQWDPEARAILVGMTRGTTKAHIARATLEAIAHQCCDVVDAMASDSGSPLKALHVDGGASANNLLMQLQADLLGIPVARRSQIEATAWGAAKLAAQGAGIEGFGQLSDDTAVTFSPQISPSDAQRQRARWQEAVDRSRSWATRS